MELIEMRPYFPGCMSAGVRESRASCAGEVADSPICRLPPPRLARCERLLSLLVGDPLLAELRRAVRA